MDARTILLAGSVIGVAGVVAVGAVPTTLQDFFMPGTQPETLDVPIQEPINCTGCHSGFNANTEPFAGWAASPMGQAARDPAFWACLAIANQDAEFAGDLCIRCHIPGGWLAGRSTPTDGSSIQEFDMHGVSCNFCHRMVDPAGGPGNPADDVAILADLQHHPVNPHSGQYVIDPQDRRRGPYDLEFFFIHEFRQSSFVRDSAMCATCHDVSNPVYELQTDGTYALGELDAPHPTHDKYDQFPVERTYSEWLESAFADGPINMAGRFGGSNPMVQSCQDCHMPETSGQGCSFGEVRDDLGRHQFNGGNTWLLDAVRMLHPDEETGLTEESVAHSVGRTVQMLQNASDMQLSQIGPDLNVRIINESGHKLPTGYPEGRRMFLNVKFFDETDELILEHGHYDYDTAILTVDDTKVYEGKLGVSQAISDATGVPVGESFHFVLNNVWIKDNRIPPRGFTNAGFDAIQASPVDYAYADGQHWDDTAYAIPPGAVRAEARLFYQSVSKEYVDFLVAENHTNDAGTTFQTVWAATGKSTPVEMDLGRLKVSPPCNAADLAEPLGTLNIDDVLTFLGAFAAMDSQADLAPPAGSFDIDDVLAFLNAFASGCP